MQKLVLYFLLFLNGFVLNAQFHFSGEVTEDFKKATAYLTIVDEYQKSDLLFTENIIQECKIDSLRKFVFKGDFLASKNMLYKIHVDTCNDEISNYKHLLNNCETSSSILFIANNTDTVFFPLNDLSQLFCEIKQTSKQNSSIIEINTLRENLLADLQNSKSDGQRSIIYKNCFQKLQDFSKTFNDPLVELYTYHLYANEKSFSRSFYLADLKESTYYANLLERLTLNYPKSNYVKQFKKDLKKDQYSEITSNKSETSILVYIIGTLLIISILLNIILFQKTKTKKELKIDYKTILTPQEQKVFELMYQKTSNKNIADSLFISVSTVKTHINNIYSKLSISSRKEVDVFFEE